MPDDSLIPGKKAQEIPLNGSVVSSVKVSPPIRTFPHQSVETFFEVSITHSSSDGRGK